MKPKFFSNPGEFRQWLQKNHQAELELLVGFYKVGSDKPSMSWAGSVTEAIAFGWIDGVRKSVNEESYTIRFSPRRPGSIWSSVNIRIAQELIESGAMMPAGLEAFNRRKEHRSSIYGYEKGYLDLAKPFEKKLRSNKKAWTFFKSESGTYQKLARHWVMNAKQEATRIRRLEILISDSEAGRKIKPFSY